MNNASEGWHNRFHLLIGKTHPDIYTSFSEIQKEQADTEATIAEFSMGRKVKAALKRKWTELQDRMSGIVQKYNTYEGSDELLMDYLRTLSPNIII